MFICAKVQNIKSDGSERFEKSYKLSHGKITFIWDIAGDFQTRWTTAGGQDDDASMANQFGKVLPPWRIGWEKFQ